MNTNTRLPISFAPAGELDAWTPSISAAETKSANRETESTHVIAQTVESSRDESQRDSGSKPRVARNELPWVIADEASTNPKGVTAWFVTQEPQPRWGWRGIEPISQGTSFLATLGWRPQSLRDWTNLPAAHAPGRSEAKAVRITPAHRRFAQRRFFTPRHTFEHRLP